MAASFDSYKIFYYVGKYGNITRAASALFLSQSTVSRTIQSLESELGCRLFVRYPHGVELTEQGEILYRSVAQGCELILAGENDLMCQAEQPQSCLRIGANDFVFQQYLIPALAEFSRFCPDVGIELTTQRFFEKDPVFTALTDAALDLLFTFTPVPDDPDLLVRPVAEVNDLLIADSCFSELRDREVSYAELESYPFVVRKTPTGGSSVAEQIFRRHGVTIRPRYRVDTIANFIPMVQQGLCLAVVPEPFFRSLHDPGTLFAVTLTEPLPSRSVCVVSSRGHSPGSAGEELIRCFRRQLSGKDNLKL